MPDEPTEAWSPRQYAPLAIKIVVSIGLMALLFSKIDIGRLWDIARKASIAWLAIALLLYLINVIASVWRWHLLLGAQEVEFPTSRLVTTYLISLFFNNFLPSNIGGDVIRIGDTARATRSKTAATMIVLGDRVLGLIGLILVAAVGATIAAGGPRYRPVPIWPAWLWAGFFLTAAISAPAVLAPDGVGRLLKPLMVVHPEWIGGRIESVTAVLSRFRGHPAAIASCFAGAVFVQAVTILFYVTVAHALHVPISPWDLAVIVPVSTVIQMAPVSVNGFGVREATFSYYFTRLGLPIESALLVSLAGVSLMMLFSLSGAVVYVARGKGERLTP
jgi:glycosyltransferase 2 family protein